MATSASQTITRSRTSRTDGSSHAARCAGLDRRRAPAAATAPSEDDLVREHLPLVQYAVAAVAARIPRHVCRDDLVSAGMFGLVQAARAFDPSRGIAFDRFAMIRIRGALLDELRQRDWASRSVRVLARRMEAATDAVRSRTGRIPNQAEIACEMGVDVATVQAVVDDVHRASVLNYEGLVVDGDFGDLLPDSGDTPQEELLEREQQAYLTDAVVSLPPRLRHVVVGSFFEERPMREIAEELGVTESRISQMRAQALTLLRSALEAHLTPTGADAPAPDAPAPSGRAARARAAYHDAVGTCRTSAERLASRPPSIQERVAALTA